MSSTTDLYTPNIVTPDELLAALDVHRRVLAQPTPAFEVPAPRTPEPTQHEDQRFWWMRQADTAPDPDSPIFDQLMFQALAGEL